MNYYTITYKVSAREETFLTMAGSETDALNNLIKYSGMLGVSADKVNIVGVEETGEPKGDLAF